MKVFLPALTLVALLQACTSNEIGNSKDVNPDAIYRSYNISYSEGDDVVWCRCQFRFAGKNGTTLILASPGSIELDSQKLYLDSSSYSGAFYYAQRQFNQFEGTHTLTYKDINGNTFPQQFVFTPFTLVTKIPAEITATDLPLSFTGMKDGFIIRVEVADTSSNTEDIYETDTVQNNGIVIKGNELAKLKDGPLDISFYADNNFPLDNPAKQGGTLNLFYKLKYQETVLKK
ncbi:MAG TPA: hypothetical protein VG738_15890 [Chitinophagaceae bacterium]|nr:hypothetical protein [Chitinophagaceae bacterium]